jgi:hypothetical protein
VFGKGDATRKMMLQAFWLGCRGKGNTAAGIYRAVLGSQSFLGAKHQGFQIDQNSLPWNRLQLSWEDETQEAAGTSKRDCCLGSQPPLLALHNLFFRTATVNTEKT